MPKNTIKLRVGFVIDDGMDKPDGVQQYILTVGKWLQANGHYVCYFAGETKREDIAEVISLSKNIKVNFNGNSLSSPLPASRLRIRKLLREQNLDILHVQMPYSPFMAARLIKESKTPTKIIGTFHVLPVGNMQYLGTKLLGYSLRRNLKKFDNFISVSEPARVFAKKTFVIDSLVIPNPVNIQKYSQKTNIKKPDGLNIVFLGRLVPRKGCMQLLIAISHLIKDKNLPKINVHICGDGPEKEKLIRYSTENGIQQIVTFHGFVSEEDKIKHLASANMAVFPSTGGESFGIVLIEAMASCTGVVLAGNNAGYASVLNSIEESLFDPNKPLELADKISNLIKDKKKYDLIHKRQQKLVKNFDIDIVGQQLLDIYLGLGQNTTK